MSENKIRVLDENISKLIAAGEVVERPASVVKELVENSIDAGSKLIQVEIEDGGISKIRITDDGCGIEKSDVKTAFLRHATSKLRTEDDLANIMTLGFRGEALASIAAVSKIKILTRTKGEVAGIRLELEAGEQKYLDEEGCPQGTSIIVRDLFFNLPARMKFLKKDNSEAAAIGSLIEKLALSHPDISFNFVKDGLLKLQTPGDGKLIMAIHEVLGKDVAKAMLPVTLTQDGLKLDGYIIHPSHTKASRSSQFFFVNGRYTKVQILTVALEEAYKNLMTVGKHPICVLNLGLPYSFVDVNVHPAKTSVKFLDEKLVYSLIYGGVKAAVTHALQPTVTKDPEEIFKGLAKEVPQFRAPTPAEIKNYRDSEIFSGSEMLKERMDEILNRERQLDLFETSNNKDPNNEKDILGELVFKGEVLGTYIVCQAGENVVLVDKHALHENLIFESLKEQKEDAVQMLLLPSVITLNPQEHDLAMQNKALFSSLGFEIDDFGDNTIVVRTVPIALCNEDIEVLVTEIIKNIVAGKNNVSPQQQDQMLYTIACKAAVKAHDKNDETELKDLIFRLNQKNGLVCCPHGRPVCCVLKRQEIEKWFKR
ncbi:DNA mismatch repair protein MutL [Clostridia bacterium]|nr:DNA mismatch repair protein MutL [Clostridia bacterium]